MLTNTNSCNLDSCMIDIHGLCNPQNTTDVISDLPYWKQMHITESLVIPQQKPDIEQINALDLSVSIFRTKVIETPRTYNDGEVPPQPLPNVEGKLLSGRKLIIEGQLCQKVSYTADEPQQSLHSAHFYVPFSSFIIVPLNVTLPTSTGGTVTLDSLNVNYEVNACIEDVSVCTLDKRRILKQVTLMLNAVPTRS